MHPDPDPCSHSLMTGFFDLQINGYGGVDFNRDDLSADDLHAACAKLRADGVKSILATFITERLELMELRLHNLARLRAADKLARDVIAGVHIEGPFINETPGFRGAHPADAIIPANLDAMKRLLDAADGLTRLVTRAPERDAAQKVTRFLSESGVRVAAGHCDASLDELKAACDAGLSLFTHLGNGCPMELTRHDNIVQRVLSLGDRLWKCFIADGAHIPFFALKNYRTIAGLDTSIVVADAIAPAGLGPGTYTGSRWTLDIGEDMVARAPDGSHLVGAAITMQQSAENLQEKLGFSPAEIERLTNENPRRALGIEHE